MPFNHFFKNPFHKHTDDHFSLNQNQVSVPVAAASASTPGASTPGAATPDIPTLPSLPSFSHPELYTASRAVAPAWMRESIMPTLREEPAPPVAMNTDTEMEIGEWLNSPEHNRQRGAGSLPDFSGMPGVDQDMFAVVFRKEQWQLVLKQAHRLPTEFAELDTDAIAHAEFRIEAGMSKTPVKQRLARSAVNAHGGLRIKHASKISWVKLDALTASGSQALDPGNPYSTLVHYTQLENGISVSHLYRREFSSPKSENISRLFFVEQAGQWYRPVLAFGLVNGEQGNGLLKPFKNHVENTKENSFQTELARFNPQKFTEEGIYKAMKIAFPQIDRVMGNDSEREHKDALEQGITASLGFLIDRFLVVSNAGDLKSFLVLKDKIICLSEPGDVDSPSFLKPVKNRGARAGMERSGKYLVAYPCDLCDDRHYKWIPGTRTVIKTIRNDPTSSVAVPRALGFQAEKGHVSARPKVVIKQLDDDMIQHGYLVHTSHGRGEITDSELGVDNRRHTSHGGMPMSPHNIGSYILARADKGISLMQIAAEINATSAKKSNENFRTMIIDLKDAYQTLNRASAKV